ncbi:hypothetical protein ACG97_11340 [Vogesella sp. EB]|uniref:hypothetical protein n=1 Tax=Vogesella sp. EB TaxID=1526735 RepID=UPI00065D93D1|nr:hypothetical protein [Vogesella sp. EB]KMJ52854.1 hypothetical protein ACG97_11340 [Vogesella sp. EB]
MMLPIRPKPRHHEHCFGYLERLAFINGFHTVSGLTAYIKIVHGNSNFGLAQAINTTERFRLRGMPPTGFSLYTDSYGNASHQVAITDYKVCPECWKIDPWVRPSWGLRLNWTCHHHHCWLVAAESLEATRDCSWLGTLPEAGESCDTVAASFGQLIDGSCVGQPWHSDVLPIVTHYPEPMQVCHLITKLGRFWLETTRNAPSSHYMLNGSVGRLVFEAAIELLNDWPRNLYHCLDLLYERAPNDFSLQRVMGCWMRIAYIYCSAPIFEPLRTATERYIHRNWKGSLNEKNRRLPPHIIESHPRLNKRAIMEKYSRRAVRLVLNMPNAFDVQFAGTDHNKPFTADFAALVDRCQLDEHTGHDLKESAKLLGLHQERVRQLWKSNILQANRCAKESPDRRWHFSQSDITAFMARFLIIDATPPGKPLTAYHFLRFHKLSDQEVQAFFTQLQNHQVHLYGVPDMPFGKLLLDRAEVTDWLLQYRTKELDELAIEEAARLLGEKDEVVFQLVKKGLLRTVSPSQRIGAARRVAREELERFKSSYVSLSWLAQQQRRRPRDLLDELKPIYPVTGPKVDGCRKYFYRREEIRRWHSQ